MDKPQEGISGAMSKAIVEQDAKIERLRKALDDAVDALYETQWGNLGTCPSCHAIADDGYFYNCRVASSIYEARKALEAHQ